MPVDRRYFDNQLKAKDLSLRGLAKLLGLSHSQLSLTFSGDRRMQIDELVQLASIFGEPINRIIEASGVSLPMTGDVRVSVVGGMQGDGTVIPAKGIERTAAPAGMGPETVAIQARTAATALEFMDGAVMFTAKPDGVASDILGRLCYLTIKGGPSAIALVKRGYAERTFNLFGPFAQESVTLEHAAPIIWTRH